jgi:hypothetical protein
MTKGQSATTLECAGEYDGGPSHTRSGAIPLGAERLVITSHGTQKPNDHNLSLTESNEANCILPRRTTYFTDLALEKVALGRIRRV